ncbi:MAG TPA: gamma-glutamylcyclotransferase family protein [Ktedonobacteraceae bacterium]|nr:gamma-glutamylcyclotransferase family protein [Ktedonobacteraceae bacterium]
MGSRSEQDDQPESVVDERTRTESSTTENFVVPGVPIVRGNTPRPHSFGQATTKTEHRYVPEQSLQSSTSDFPSVAPGAPPLPEDDEDGEATTTKQLEFTSSPSGNKPEASHRRTSEFMWLFEYGLEMDSAFLNSAERLQGLALTYGPAVLRGYRIVLDGVEVHPGQVVATIVPTQESDAEVWGILYRVPRRVTERDGDEPALLERVHAAKVFVPLEVTVQELYRKREVTCLTYIAPVTVQRRIDWLSPEQEKPESGYTQQLLACAISQKLPDAYLAELKRYATTAIEEKISASPMPVERDTEPLPIVSGVVDADTSQKKTMRDEQHALQVVHSTRWLSAFALYLVLLLLATLTLSLLQALGYWNNVFTINFAVLSVPWYVLIYGVLGACVSGILTLGKQHTVRLPAFVVMTWFARPFVGLILAALAYLFLNSGLLVISGNAGQHYSLNALTGALAGFCEGWVFFRKR